MDFPHYEPSHEREQPSQGGEQGPGVRFGRGWIPVERDIGLPEDGPSIRSVAPAQAGAHAGFPAGASARSMPDPSDGPLPAQGRREVVSRHHAWTPFLKARFLDDLAEHGNVRLACARVGFSAEAAYRLRRREALFAAGWAAALVLAREHVGQVLADRALNGVQEHVWYRGELVGTRVRHDSRLLLAHMARLDRMAEDSEAGPRATRFDELLALVAGERFPDDMADYADDPLFPTGREDHAWASRKRGKRRALAEAMDEAGIEDWEGVPDPDRLLEDEDQDELLDAVEDAAERAEEQGRAEWDGWQVQVGSVTTALDAAAEELEAEARAEAGPMEFKSLNPVSLNSVNCVNLAGRGAGAVYDARHFLGGGARCSIASDNKERCHAIPADSRAARRQRRARHRGRHQAFRHAFRRQ